MRARRFMTGIGEFFDTVGSAMAISAAVRDRRPAHPADLARLGIDAEQFRQISRR